MADISVGNDTSFGPRTPTIAKFSEREGDADASPYTIFSNKPTSEPEDDVDDLDAILKIRLECLEPERKEAYESSPLSGYNLQGVQTLRKDHFDLVVARVNMLLEAKMKESKRLPTKFHMPYKVDEESGQLTFDEWRIAAADDDAFDKDYPGYVVMERYSTSVWCKKLQAFAVSAASRLGSLQADIVYGGSLWYSTWLPRRVFYCYTAALCAATALSLLIASRRVLHKHQRQKRDRILFADRPSSWLKIEYDWSRGFYALMLLDYLCASGDLVDAADHLGGRPRNYGWVGAGAESAPLVSLGNNNKREYDNDPAFLCRLPSVILQEGVCFGIQIYVSVFNMGHSHEEAVVSTGTLMALFISTVTFAMEMYRAIRWIRAFRKTRTYHERRFDDTRQPEKARKTSEDELKKMRDQCPVM